MNQSRTVTIHYHRLGKPLTIFTEGFISDDGVTLRTYTQIPTEIARHLTNALRKDGLIGEQHSITAVRKTYFYNEHFNLLEFLGPQEGLVGYYSDIGLPLTQTNEGYAMTDLFLDLWLSPEGKITELDWDEFEAAVANNTISKEQAEAARAALQRLVHEAKSGIYPYQYLSAPPKEA